MTKVCFCFNHTRESIREEIQRTGESTVVAEIVAGIRAGACACASLHPRGTCCLADVKEEVRRAREEVGRVPGS